MSSLASHRCLFSFSLLSNSSSTFRPVFFPSLVQRRARGCTRFGPAIIPELRFPACRALVIMRGEPCISHRCIIRECFSRSFRSSLPLPSTLLLTLSLSLSLSFPFFLFLLLVVPPSYSFSSSPYFYTYSLTVPGTQQGYNEFFEGGGRPRECSRAAIKFDARLNAVIRSVIGITRLSRLTRVDFHSKRLRRAVNQPLSIRTSTEAPALCNSPLPFSLFLSLSLSLSLFRPETFPTTVLSLVTDRENIELEVSLAFTI